MNIYTVKRAMEKRAAIPGLAAAVSTAKTLIGVGAASHDAISNAALYLLGAAAVAGGGIGAVAANVTAHGKQDEDTVKREYENERLKADVGYVASRLEDEWNRSKSATKPKAARVLNV